MRILQVCPYDWTSPGGVQRHVAGLSRALSDRNHQVRIVAPGPAASGDDAAVHVVGRPVGIRFNGSVAPICLSVRSALRIRTLLRDWRPDVVHVHEPFAPSTSLLATVLASVPLVATFHARLERAVIHRAMAPVLRRIWDRIDAPIAVSSACAAFIESALGVRAELVPNGIDVPTAVRCGHRPRGQGRVVLFVGRLEPRKGLPVLLRAFTLLAARFPDLSLVVIGDGQDRRALQDLPASVSDRVAMLGAASDRTVSHWLQAAHVFAGPATGRESFGVVLLEAMAAGLPIVASNIDGYRSVARHDLEALLVTPGDAAALAAGIARVLDDQDLAARLADAGSRRVADYSWTSIAERLDTLYGQARESYALRRHRGPVASRGPRPVSDDRLY